MDRYWWEPRSQEVGERGTILYILPNQGSQHFLELACSKCSVLNKCTQPNMTLHTPTLLTANFERTTMHLRSWNSASCACCKKNCASQTYITVLHSLSWSLGPSMAISIFHWCLVRSHPFACNCPVAGLFPFLKRQYVISGLRASERNWFRTIIMTIICINFF